MVRYRVAVTEFNADLRIILRQSEAALTRSHLLLLILSLTSFGR